MKREDVIKVDELKAELADAFRSFERRLTSVFGELVYSIDTVVERYNDVQTQLDAVTQRLLEIERRLGPLQ